MYNSNSKKTQFKKGNHFGRKIKKGQKLALGYKHSKEHNRKISEAERGEKGHNWQGGKSFEPYSIDWTDTLRQSIRERDHYICQLCNKPQCNRLHSVHHIDYDKKNCCPENLITLCVSCNFKVNFNREKWINYFKKPKGDPETKPS